MTPEQRESRVGGLAKVYGLAIPRQPTGGVIGQMLGSAVGNSLEFQDHRTYSPGDDPRHIDWSAYARTDQLTVRLYREEVSPRLEVVVDASASMATGGKGELLRSLLLLLVRLADKGRAAPVLWEIGERIEPVRHDLAAAIDRLELRGAAALAEQLAAAPIGFAPRSMRLVVSDFLFPHDADAIVRRVADRAASLAMVQLLTAEEDRPTVGRPAKLVDVESGEFLDVTMDPPAVRRYRDRLTALQTGLARAVRRAAGTFVTIVDTMSLADACRDVLTPAGVLEVR
ncbi:MAG: DUF58 domain-containing protein [Phycisphaerae bacterium]|nr:DUF58 domain-containing protein [Phycisphaerae bacterium]